MSRDLFDLTGRRALVTGSSRGIGLALTRGLAGAGAQVLLDGRDPDRLHTLADEIPGAAVLAFDLTDHAAAQAAVDGFEDATGPIDIPVNNARVQHRAPLQDVPAEEWERLLRTNVSSLFHVGPACARRMIARGRGKIVNIASVQTSPARAGIASYTATKGAIGNLTKGMAADRARFGINCNAVAPGCIRTDINRVLQDDPEFDRWLEVRTPAGRWGRTGTWWVPAHFWPRLNPISSTATSFMWTAASPRPSDPPQAETARITRRRRARSRAPRSPSRKTAIRITAP